MQDRLKKDISFTAPVEVMPPEEALRTVNAALQRWQLSDPARAREVHEALLERFPDHYAPDEYWQGASSQKFRDFFVWGHNHEFAPGIVRSGAMGDRHKEITSELISLGMLPVELRGKEVLDIGCWSGGDLLILAGLGANVVAIEEHPIAAAAAGMLCEQLGCRAPIIQESLYQDNPEWRQRFDLLYCSGVIYHVTDPLLFLRICFAYLKPGGRLVLETKMHEGDEAVCGYAGTLEKGWNWYAPTGQILGRWLVDAGFDHGDIVVHRRPIGRLLASAVKQAPRSLPETAGFSRPGSWLEGEV